MCKESEIDWSSTTWEGSRRTQIRDWAKLTLLQKLQAAEELEALGRFILAKRKARGEPYINPDTGTLVPGQESKHPPLEIAESKPRFNSKKIRD